MRASTRSAPRTLIEKADIRRRPLRRQIQAMERRLRRRLRLRPRQAPDRQPHPRPHPSTSKRSTQQPSRSVKPQSKSSKSSPTSSLPNYQFDAAGIWLTWTSSPWRWDAGELWETLTWDDRKTYRSRHSSSAIGLKTAKAFYQGHCWDIDVVMDQGWIVTFAERRDVARPQDQRHD